MNKDFLKKGICEFIVFFLATLGFSDFTLNTALFKKTGWVKDEFIPGTIICSYIVPGTIIAFVYLSGETTFEIKTLVICVLVYMVGIFLGSGKMLTMDGNRIRKFIGYAMIFSMFALILRLVVSRGAMGTAAGLKGIQFLIAVPMLFVLGYLLPFGVPMKPVSMAMFMLLGLSPLATLTYIMVIGMAGAFSAGARILKSGRYEKSLVRAAATFGSAGAIIGSLFALSMNPYLLTGLMMIVMAFVAYTMLKKPKAE